MGYSDYHYDKIQTRDDDRTVHCPQKTFWVFIINMLVSIYKLYLLLNVIFTVRKIVHNDSCPSKLGRVLWLKESNTIYCRFVVKVEEGVVP